MNNRQLCSAEKRWNIIWSFFQEKSIEPFTEQDLAILLYRASFPRKGKRSVSVSNGVKNCRNRHLSYEKTFLLHKILNLRSPEEYTTKILKERLLKYILSLPIPKLYLVVSKIFDNHVTLENPTTHQWYVSDGKNYLKPMFDKLGWIYKIRSNIKIKLIKAVFYRDGRWIYIGN